MSLFSPRFSCGVKYHDCIFVSSSTFNALIKVRIDDGRTEYVMRFPNSNLLIELQHSRAYLYNDKIFFIPAFGNYIHIYDPISNNIKAIAIDRLSYIGEYYGLLYGNNVILSPKNVGGDLLCFDMNSMEVSVILKWEKMKDYFPENAIYAFLRVTRLDYRMFLPIYDTSFIFVINLNSYTIETKCAQVDNLLGVFGGDNGIYLLSNNNSSINKWDYANNKVEKCFYDASFEKEINFTFAIEMHDRTYFFPGNSNDNIGKVQNGKIFPFYKLECPNGQLLFLEPFYSDNKIWALPFEGENLLCISEKGVIKKRLSEIEINQSEKDEIIKEKLNSETLFVEGDSITIDDFIRGIII